MASLRSSLTHTPEPLRFGTSGRRGLITNLTQLEIYTVLSAELTFLLCLPLSQGGIQKGEEFYYAYDLRPSSTTYDSEGHGGIAQAVERAIIDQGMVPVNLGAIPTPALAAWALSKGKGSVMVTGSHIPFDRNGYKLNTSVGELMKTHEAPIETHVKRVREQLLDQNAEESLFDPKGAFKHRPTDLLPISNDGREAYIQRYRAFFASDSLEGLHLMVYQHSAVGRDLLVEVLESFGAKVTQAGRSDHFVPIDTEAIDTQQLQTVQALIDQTGQTFDAVLSTDGDSDRPLILAPASQGLAFFGGDLLGMITAGFLGCDAVVVPISTNDGIDRGSLATMLEPKTKIGSPYVIQGMAQAIASGRQAVCGWEANGGFLTGSDIKRRDRVLTALPTRDAILPILCVLFAAKQAKSSLPELFATLPARFSRAGLLRNFPKPTSLKIIERFSPSDPCIDEVHYQAGTVTAVDSKRRPVEMSEELVQRLLQVKTDAESVLSADHGFTEVSKVIYTDGVRIVFSNGDVAHFRPSGNADELRIYAVSDTQERADAIVDQGVAEPNGLLRTLEKMVKGV